MQKFRSLILANVAFFLSNLAFLSKSSFLSLKNNIKQALDWLCSVTDVTALKIQIIHNNLTENTLKNDQTIDYC